MHYEMRWKLMSCSLWGVEGGRNYLQYKMLVLGEESRILLYMVLKIIVSKIVFYDFFLCEVIIYCDLIEEVSE